MLSRASTIAWAVGRFCGSAAMHSLAKACTCDHR